MCLLLLVTPNKQFLIITERPCRGSADWVKKKDIFKEKCYDKLTDDNDKQLILQLTFKRNYMNTTFIKNTTVNS